MVMGSPSNGDVDAPDDRKIARALTPAFPAALTRRSAPIFPTWSRLSSAAVRIGRTGEGKGAVDDWLEPSVGDERPYEQISSSRTPP